jgi:hypothetical protein
MLVTEHLKQPTRIPCGPHALIKSRGFLFGLAPSGVCPAATVTSYAVRFYRTFSPLPNYKIRRYIFCGTFRQLRIKSEFPRRYLALCPKEPGLSSTLYSSRLNFRRCCKALSRQSCITYTLLPSRSLCA